MSKPTRAPLPPVTMRLGGVPHVLEQVEIEGLEDWRLGLGLVRVGTAHPLVGEWPVLLFARENK